MAHKIQIDTTKTLDGHSSSDAIINYSTDVWFHPIARTPR